MKIPKFSMGIGDRFGKQGQAQLSAFIEAKNKGIIIAPVWNKSNREHQIIGSTPSDVRREADTAVKSLGWQDAYFVDADHINNKNVISFLEYSDFFTIDVADYVGKVANDAELIENFSTKSKKLLNKTLCYDSEGNKITITEEDIKICSQKYLSSVSEAKAIYDTIKKAKGENNFVAELSMDETNEPQCPALLLLILLAVSHLKIPIQTVAPKFTGRFNKGVDYVGDINKFDREFAGDLAVINFAKKEFDLPPTLKISIHSGSDKFSIYPVIKSKLQKTGEGLHLKTAGTTWLEECIGLAEAGGDCLKLVKKFYKEALKRRDELCTPYATVIDINFKNLPQESEVDKWDKNQFINALKHNKENKEFNPDLRQLMHIAYKIAAESSKEFYSALEYAKETVAKNVRENILERHIKPLFM